MEWPIPNRWSVDLELKILSDVRLVIGLTFVMVLVKLSIVQTVWIQENVIWTCVQDGPNGVAGLDVLKHVAW